jgi:hypothetical protein
LNEGRLLPTIENQHLQISKKCSWEPAKQGARIPLPWALKQMRVAAHEPKEYTPLSI